MDEGWKFHLGDIPFPEIKGHSNTYDSAKAGNVNGAAAPGYDDTLWRSLDLPHDWVVEGPFDPEANLSQGYRRRGVGWYRRIFQLPESDRDRHLEIQFDGIATHATVWLNGTVVHRNWCGYTSFHIDITPFARFGAEINTLSIRVDAVPQEGWWYEGGGIYRHTWLVKRDPVHIITDGVYAQPQRQQDGLTWRLPAEINLHNCGEKSETVDVVSILLDPEGTEVTRAGCTATVPPLGTPTVHYEMEVHDPVLWSVENPSLYKVRTQIIRNGQVGDSVVTPCGFRTFRWDAAEGFFLNDKPLKLQGTCNHQDHAGVGVAVPDALWEFRVRRLKEMGSNAYRCAHNPPAAEFLDVCDRLGILVMDENRHFNSSPEYLRQLEWLVRRDRNHPCIFLWSVFNEEPQQGSRAGYEMVRRMADKVRSLDTLRPVTAAMNGGFFEPVNVSQAVDVIGFNYSTHVYDEFHAKNPDKPSTSSEDTSAFMTRGEFFTDAERNLMGSLDTEHAVWGTTHRRAWRLNAERPWLGGGFIWTGFDYRGEPSPWSWPSASSFFGCMDLCGFPKTAFHIHRAHWIKSQPVLHIEPHWNWPGCEGKIIEVLTITNAETVELFLNGKSLGTREIDPIDMTLWHIPYEPGCLEAVAKTAGREVARFRSETTGDAKTLELIPDRKELLGDGRDAVPVTVRALDSEGRAVPTASVPVSFSIEGPAAIIGLGNGDPNCHEPEKGAQRSLFHGLAQVIVQAALGCGTVKLRASAPGLNDATLELIVQQTHSIPTLPTSPSVLELSKWRQSPGFGKRPDPLQPIVDNDQNTWEPVTPGTAHPIRGGGVFTIFRTTFVPFQGQQQAGGTIVFSSIEGRAEIWIGENIVAEKTTATADSAHATFAPIAGELTISVLVESSAGLPAGFSGPVFVS